MKQNVASLRYSPAQRQRQIARVLIILGLVAAWGHQVGLSMGLSSQSASALTPISIMSLVAGFALAVLTRQELKACQAQQGAWALQQAAMDGPASAPTVRRRLQLIHANPAAAPRH